MDEDDLDLADVVRSIGADGKQNEAKSNVLSFVLRDVVGSVDKGARTTATGMGVNERVRTTKKQQPYPFMLSTIVSAKPMSSAQATGVVLDSKSGRLFNCDAE